jgi:hypothetical protein
VVEGNVGYVGTNDPIVPYHEYGTSRIPARPFLGGALAAAGDEIPKIFGRLVSAAMMHGGPNYHELKELMHVQRAMRPFQSRIIADRVFEVEPMPEGDTDAQGSTSSRHV